MHTREEKLNIIYQETVEMHKQHQVGIDLVYNKLNWILVSGMVFLAMLYSGRHTNMLIVIIASASTIVTLVGFERRTFHVTKKISDQLAEVESENFLENLIVKKVAAFNANEKQNKQISDLMHWASWLLIAAVGLQCLLMLL